VLELGPVLALVVLALVWWVPTSASQ